EGLQGQSLEESVILADRLTPFGVVVRQVIGGTPAPAAAGQPVRTDDEIHLGKGTRLDEAGEPAQRRPQAHPGTAPQRRPAQPPRPVAGPLRASPPGCGAPPAPCSAVPRARAGTVRCVPPAPRTADRPWSLSCGPAARPVRHW